MFGVERAARRGDKYDSALRWSTVDIGTRSREDIKHVHKVTSQMHMFGVPFDFGLDPWGVNVFKLVGTNRFMVCPNASTRALNDPAPDPTAKTFMDTMAVVLASRITNIRNLHNGQMVTEYNPLVPVEEAIAAQAGHDDQPTLAATRVEELHLRALLWDEGEAMEDRLEAIATLERNGVFDW